MEYYTPFDIFPESEFSTNESYVAHVSTLPKSIRSILAGASGADFIRENLQPTFHLDEGQVLSISEIIRDVLIGTLFIGDLTQSITSEVEIDSVNAKKMSDIIVAQLFVPAIQDIKELQKKYFSDRLSGGGSQSASSQPQSSQTINLRSQAPAAPPRPAPGPVDPIIASLKTQQDAPRPTPPQPTSTPPQQNSTPQSSPQPQVNPQKTQNVFKIPDIDFGSDQPQSQPKQDGPKNVLDLRDQK